MRNFTTTLVFGLGLFLACPAAAQPAQGVSAGADASAEIIDGASISVLQNLTFTVPPQSLNSGLSITSSAASGANANFALTGTQTTSVSIPATFNVVRIGGVETITVRTVGSVGLVTGANGANGATTVTGLGGSGPVTGLVAGGGFDNPVVVVGTLDSGVLSFSVGGAVTLANNLVPGQYQGVLTVLAQYN